MDLDIPTHLTREEAIEWLRPRVDAMSLAERWTALHRLGIYHGEESLSGPGSSLDETAAIRGALPEIIRRHGIASLLDVPCGDFHWMALTDLAGAAYTGADIVPEIVAANEVRYGSPGRRFLLLDATRDALPRADLVHCRDLLIHLSLADISRVLDNIAASGARFLLTNTYTSRTVNPDIPSGDFRPLNLRLPPFDFPEPLALIDERCQQGDGLYRDKAMALWPVAGITSRRSAARAPESGSGDPRPRGCSRPVRRGSRAG